MKNFKIFSVLALVACTLQVSASATRPVVSKIINGVTIRVEKGDITQSKAQAIVNAANSQLLSGGGVCGAIFSAAGLDRLQKACNQWPILSDDIRCPVGSACITDSFDLARNGIKYIIHAVGPDCRIIKDPQKQDGLLHSAYLNALIMAEKNNVTTVAFPFISSAIYAFPKERAARIALEAMTGYATGKNTQAGVGSNTKLTIVSFVLFSDEDYDLFVKTLDALMKKAS